MLFRGGGELTALLTGGASNGIGAGSASDAGRSLRGKTPGDGHLEAVLSTLYKACWTGPATASQITYGITATAPEIAHNGKSYFRPSVPHHRNYIIQ